MNTNRVAVRSIDWLGCVRGIGESDIGNAARKRLPETKLKLSDVKIAERLIRVAALARPKMQTAEIFVVSPVGVGKRVAEGSDWVVGEKTAAFAGGAPGWAMLVENLEARVTEIHEAKVVLRDDLSANDSGVSWNGTDQIHEPLKGDQLLQPGVQSDDVLCSNLGYGARRERGALLGNRSRKMIARR